MTIIDVNGRECMFPLTRDLFSYGNRTEEEIEEELKKTAYLLKDKFISINLPESGLEEYDAKMKQLDAMAAEYNRPYNFKNPFTMPS